MLRSPVLARLLEPDQLYRGVALPRNRQQRGRGKGIALQVGLLCVCHLYNSWLDSKGKEWFSSTTLWWWDGMQRQQSFQLRAGLFVSCSIFSTKPPIFQLQPFWLLCTWPSWGRPISTRNSALPRRFHWWFFSHVMNALRYIHHHIAQVMFLFSQSGLSTVSICSTSILRSEDPGRGRQAYFPPDPRRTHDLWLQLDFRQHCAIPWQLIQMSKWGRNQPPIVKDKIHELTTSLDWIVNYPQTLKWMMQLSTHYWIAAKNDDQ